MSGFRVAGILPAGSDSVPTVEAVERGAGRFPKESAMLIALVLLVVFGLSSVRLAKSNGRGAGWVLLRTLGLTVGTIVIINLVFFAISSSIG